MSKDNSIPAKRMLNTIPDLTDIYEYFRLNERTGEFFWKKRSGPRCLIGSLAGSINDHGYIQLALHGRRYMAHRVVWMISRGIEPKGQIDHINGNRSDNRPENLRDVTQSVNLQNRRAYNKNGESGLLGVSHVKRLGKWCAFIRVPLGKRLYLGLYSTPELAHEAYMEVKRKLHPGCTI